MQKLKTEITIQIPESHVLKTKAEIEELESLAGASWVKGLNWLKEQTGIRSTVTLRENLLYKYRKELEINCVTYPSTKGEHWYFNVIPMKKWLRDNFRRIEK